MPNSCVAPKCEVGYKKRKRKRNKEASDEDYTPVEPPKKKYHVHEFPDEKTKKELFDRWKNAVPRQNFTPTENSVL